MSPAELRALAAFRWSMRLRDMAASALPPMPYGPAAWGRRQLSRGLPSAARVAIREQVASVLALVADDGKRAEAEARLSYVLGETVEPRRYVKPGEVVLTREQVGELAELLEAASLDLVEWQSAGALPGLDTAEIGARVRAQEAA